MSKEIILVKDFLDYVLEHSDMKQGEKMMKPPTTCEICGEDDIQEYPIFIQGICQMSTNEPATMCKKCFGLHGIGLGPGLGEAYSTEEPYQQVIFLKSVSILLDSVEADAVCDVINEYLEYHEEHQEDYHLSDFNKALHDAFLKIKEAIK